MEYPKQPLQNSTGAAFCIIGNSSQASYEAKKHDRQDAHAALRLLIRV